MTVAAHVFVVVATVLALVGTLLLLRRRSFRERHAIWWIGASVLAVVVAIFPGALEAVAGFLGVFEATNLVLFLAVTVLFLVCVQFSSEITGIEARVRRLAEESALLRERLDRLEEMEEQAEADVRPSEDRER